MTADDPRPAGEAVPPPGPMDEGARFRRAVRDGADVGDVPFFRNLPPAASGGATDGERDRYGHTKADHDAAGACVRPVPHRDAAGVLWVPITDPAPVASQADGELREEIAAWEFARHAPARYWGSGALDAEEADARDSADDLLALPIVRRLLADAAKVQRVEALIDPEAGMASVLWGERLFSERDIRRALDGDL